MRKFRISKVTSTRLQNFTNLLNKKVVEGSVLTYDEIKTYAVDGIIGWDGNVESWNGRCVTQLEEVFGQTNPIQGVQQIMYTKKMMDAMGVESVIVNDDAVIVTLKTGVKGVAVQSGDDEYDLGIGFAVAYAYAMGTNGSKVQFKKNMVKVEKHSGFKKVEA